MSQPLKILVVDDDQSLSHVMSTHLRRRGFVVEEATNGFSALEHIRSNGPFAVLVTDLMMRKMTGLELLRQARAIDPRMEAIVITAAGSLESAISAMREDGAYDYLLKPFESLGQLSLAVERAAAHRQLRLDREALQAQLAEEASRLQALIAHTGDAILAANAEGVLTVVNPAAAQLLGEASLVGREAASGLPAHLASLIANWQSIGGGRPMVVEVAWPADRVHTVSLAPLPGSQGQGGTAPGPHQGWVMVMRDITHLTRLDDLKMRLLTETASRIQVPLAQAIGNLAELNTLPEAKSERFAEIVARLTRVWGRVQEWMDDLVDLARIESGAGLRALEVEFSALWKEALKELARGQTRDRRIKLESTLEPDLPLVRADPDLLRRLLVGLINRAAQRSERGGSVLVRARHHQNQLWIEVGDEGPSLGEADLAHIFDRSPGGPSAGASGTGLELALAKTICDRLGGQIWVGGEGAVGSLVTVCLPAAPRAA